MARRPLLLMAAGGTGGHMFPAQALAEEMLARGWRVVLSTDARGARYTGGFPAQVRIHQVASATFARAGAAAKLLVPFQIMAGILLSTISMLFDRPAMVVGFGGYPSIPALTAAWLLRCRRMVHEQNGAMGRVNRLFVRRVNHVACGTWPTVLSQRIRHVTHTGNPVRTHVLACEKALYIPPGPYPMLILVIGGSQGARLMSQVVPKAFALLPEELRALIRVAHQARADDMAQAKALYDTAQIRTELAPFFEDIPRRLADAQLVISRAGASSLADITVIGRPSILIPFAAATGDHQTVNAQSLAQAGAAVVIPEKDLTPETLAHEINRLLSDPDKSQAMAGAALSIAVPDAAQRLADLVEKEAAVP